jgi:hypothetical protein
MPAAMPDRAADWHSFNIVSQSFPLSRRTQKKPEPPPVTESPREYVICTNALRADHGQEIIACRSSPGTPRLQITGNNFQSVYHL